MCSLIIDWYYGLGEVVCHHVIHDWGEVQRERRERVIRMGRRLGHWHWFHHFSFEPRAARHLLLLLFACCWCSQMTDWLTDSRYYYHAGRCSAKLVGCCRWWREGSKGPFHWTPHWLAAAGRQDDLIGNQTVLGISIKAHSHCEREKEVCRQVRVAGGSAMLGWDLWVCPASMWPRRGKAGKGRWKWREGS